MCLGKERKESIIKRIVNTITKGRGQYVCGDVGMRKRKDTNNTSARENKHHA